MKVLSLFANIGVAEAYLEQMGIDVVLANELDEKRVAVYSKIYPDTEVICGDITQGSVRDEIVRKAIEQSIDIVMATPPCQGMSTAGKLDEDDVRNTLIKDAIEVVKRVKPKYVFLENVPMQLMTKIKHKGRDILIPNYIEDELADEYYIISKVINVCNYGVPQNRERAIYLLTNKKVGQNHIWDFPQRDSQIKTLKDAIGHLPILDPFVKDIPYDKMLQLFPNYETNKQLARQYSRWHTPPVHIYRQVNVMMHTPTGHSAFENEKYLPVKSDGTVVRGYKNTYKRQNWDMPGYTITMYNRTISSQNNVHPGRMMGYDENGDALYSDPRVLTLYELMLVMSLPPDWPLPEDVSESFLRSVIGEGIPPRFIERVFSQLVSDRS